jgi:N-methylhydantoinase A
VPVSISSDVVPEMQEYERTVTTVANSYVRPRVQKYVHNLQSRLERPRAQRQAAHPASDGGLASSKSAEELPVNLLMSGPAGGVTGALWEAVHAGFPNLLTIDVGGTSTDVALDHERATALRRETTVGDVTVRASSVDIRTVGAGGGSIAHVPELTVRLRVGPQSAGAGARALRPTTRVAPSRPVTDANVVLGYLPEMQRLGGDMPLNRERAHQAVEKIGKALGKSVKDAALGIYDIVNENMVGALRLVSVEQGHDPRDYALIAFGGAGPLHANALARLLGAWPAIIPPGPGVLCALGDATTAVRDESSRTFIRKFSETTPGRDRQTVAVTGRCGCTGLAREKVDRFEMEFGYQVDVRYHGQGLRLTIDVDLKRLEKEGLSAITRPFDAEHSRLFTFALPLQHEFVSLRAVVQGKGIRIRHNKIARGGGDAKAAVIGRQKCYMEGRDCTASIYDRSVCVPATALPARRSSSRWIRRRSSCRSTMVASTRTAIS